MNLRNYHLLLFCLVFLISCKPRQQYAVIQITDTTAPPSTTPTELPTEVPPTVTAIPKPTDRPIVTLPPLDNYYNLDFSNMEDIDTMCSEYPMAGIEIPKDTGADIIFNEVASSCYGEGEDGIWNLFSHITRQVDQNDGHHMFVLDSSGIIIPFGILPGQVNIYVDPDKATLTSSNIGILDERSIDETQLVELGALVLATDNFNLYGCAGTTCDSAAVDVNTVNVFAAEKYTKSNLDVLWLYVSDGQGNSGWANANNFTWLYNPEADEMRPSKASSRGAEYRAYESVAPKLSPEVVGFPLDWTVKQFTVKPCSFKNETRFHAGDAFFYINLGYDEKIPVLAPTDGHLNSASWVNQSVGYEINMETPFLYKDKIVYFDLVHLGELAQGVHSGMNVNQGQVLGYITNAVKAGGGIPMLDIAARNNERFQANPDYWNEFGTDGTEYFPFLPFVEDDLKLMPAGTFIRSPQCLGNIYPQD